MLAGDVGFDGAASHRFADRRRLPGLGRPVGALAGALGRGARAGGVDHRGAARRNLRPAAPVTDRVRAQLRVGHARRRDRGNRLPGGGELRMSGGGLLLAMLLLPLVGAAVVAPMRTAPVAAKGTGLAFALVELVLAGLAWSAYQP